MCAITTGKDIPYYIYARAKEKDDGVNGIDGINRKDGETTGWGLREGGFHGRRGKVFCQVGKNVFAGRGESFSRQGRKFSTIWLKTLFVFNIISSLAKYLKIFGTLS